MPETIFPGAGYAGRLPLGPRIADFTYAALPDGASALREICFAPGLDFGSLVRGVLGEGTVAGVAAEGGPTGEPAGDPAELGGAPTGAGREGSAAAADLGEGLFFWGHSVCSPLLLLCSAQKTRFHCREGL